MASPAVKWIAKSVATPMELLQKRLCGNARPFFAVVQQINLKMESVAEIRLINDLLYYKINIGWQVVYTVNKGI